MLGKKIPFNNLFSIVCVHNFVNAILPARTGELSYIYLLKKHDINLEERISTLVIARILDFIIMAIVFIFAFMLVKDHPDFIVGAFWIITIFLVFFILLLVGLLFYSDSFKNGFNRLTVIFKIDRYRTIKKISTTVEDTISSFKKFREGKLITRTVLISILIWSVLFIAYFLYTQAFQLELEYIEVTLIVAFLAFLPLLPIYGAGGFGTTEAAITLVLVSFGISEAVAIVASFGIHIIGLLFVIILGVAGFIKIGMKI